MTAPGARARRLTGWTPDDLAVAWRNYQSKTLANVMLHLGKYTPAHWNESGRNHILTLSESLYGKKDIFSYRTCGSKESPPVSCLDRPYLRDLGGL